MSLVAYAWVLDGIGTIFVTDEGLDNAWAVAAGFDRSHVGLAIPSGLSCGIDLRTGLLTDESASFTVADIDGTLAALFRAARSDKTALINTLEPGGSPPASTYSKHVGLEHVGPAGERRRYSCVPGFNIGLKHYGQNEAFSVDLGATPVSGQPVLWAGRKCAVYRVENIGGTWQTLVEAKRIWWGTLRGQGTFRRQSWSFACDGPQTWLAGGLGRGVFERGLAVRPSIQVSDTRMYAALQVIRLTDLDVHHKYGDINDADFNDDAYLVGADSYADVAAAVNSFLGDIVSSTAGGVSAYNEHGNGILFSTIQGSEGVTLTWSRGGTTGEGDPYVDSNDPITLTARLILSAHETVWAALGYDVRQQNNAERDAVEHFDQYGQFESDGKYPGFWVGKFYAAAPSVIKAFDEGTVGQTGASEDDYQNGGNGRVWPPLFPRGLGSFTGEPLQEIELVSADPVLLTGSKSRPLPADPDDASSPYELGNGVGDVTHQALLMLEGPYRRRGDKDSVDPVAGYAFELERERREGKTVQVVRVAFRRQLDGTIATGSGSNARLVVVQWYDPRLFGFGFTPISGTWGTWIEPPADAETILARPLAVWDVRDGGDRISEVLQRLLLTTGTAGTWYTDQALTTPAYGLGQVAYLDRGDNDSAGTVPKDAEDATLGLGVPSSMVQGPAHWDAAESPLGPHLRRCKVAAYGVQDARELIGRLLAPAGLALSLSGGKYGLIDAWALATPEDAALVITPELYGGRSGKPASAAASQSLRKWAAIDRIEIRGRIDPQTNEYAREDERAATDGGAAYRRLQVVHEVAADYVIHPSLPIIGNNWFGELVSRWRSGFDFWATDNSEITVKLHEEDALDVWPGDGVLITDPELLSSVGSYGISTAAGRVLYRSADPDRKTITLRLLVGDESTLRLYAPAARVTNYDADNFRLLCEDDWLGDRNGGLDVGGFAEPSYSSEGGTASVELFQFDGVSWHRGIYQTVTGVNAVAGSCYLQLAGALTGATYYRDMLTIAVLRGFSDQSAAWPKRWHAPICEPDGTHSGGEEGAEFL